jgi:peptidoglycan/LPS O-acetylase OafA/YrhL
MPGRILQYAGPDAPAPALGLQRRYLPALDGWRGIAVFSVVFYHMWPWRRPHCAWFASWGWIGVDLFFVLSGFLITRILLAARDGPRYFRNFYARRTLRIFPLYYAVVLIAAVLWPLFGPENQSARYALPRAGVALGYVTNLWQAHFGQWFTVPKPFLVGHFWSLAVEEQFYLVWPVVVLLLHDRRKLLAACAACVAITMGTRLASWVDHANPLVPFCFTPCRLDGLGLGAALAVAATEPRWAALARRASWLVLGLTLPAFVLCGIRCHSFDHADNFLMRTVGLSVAAPLCASALFLTTTASPAGLAERILTWRPLRWLGTYSYGLYVYHGLLIGWLHDHVGMIAWRHIHRPWLADPCFFLADAGCAAAVAVLSFHLFEQPILRLKRFFPEPLSPDEKTGYR